MLATLQPWSATRSLQQPTFKRWGELPTGVLSLLGAYTHTLCVHIPHQVHRGFISRRKAVAARDEELVFIGMKAAPTEKSDQLAAALELAKKKRKTEQVPQHLRTHPHSAPTLQQHPHLVTLVEPGGAQG